MPRQRRTRQQHVNLASLIQSTRHHPYNLRRRRTARDRNGGGMRTLRNKNAIPEPSAARTATGVQPIFSARQHYVPSASASVMTVRSSNSQLQIAFGEVEIPCCASAAPEVTSIVHSPTLRCQRVTEPQIHNDQLSTIVLHRNLYFDGEGTTRSGLLRPHISKTDTSPAMGANTAKSHYASAKKSGSKKRPIKNYDSDGSSASDMSVHGSRRRGSGAGGGSRGSRVAQTCSESMASSASSGKSKSDSDESNSFDGTNDDCMVMALKASTKFNLNLNIEREIALHAAVSPVNPTTTTTTTGMPPDRDVELAPPPNSPTVPHIAPTTCNSISIHGNNTLANILESVDNFLKAMTTGKPA